MIGDDGTTTVPPIDYYSDPDLLQNQSWGEWAVVMSAGVVFNLILAFTCFFGLYAVGELPKAVFNEGLLLDWYRLVRRVFIDMYMRVFSYPCSVNSSRI